VSLGGGEDGAPVLEHYLEAWRNGWLPKDLVTVLVTQPSASGARRAAGSTIESPTLRVVEFVPGLEHLLAAADVVVGAAGYDTVCDVLAARVPAVLIPCGGREQLLRSERFGRLGISRHLPPEQADARNIAYAILDALEVGRLSGPPPRVDGFSRMTWHLDRLLPRGKPKEARALMAAAGRAAAN
jgi:predicted glycosyltransferase